MTLNLLLLIFSVGLVVLPGRFNAQANLNIKNVDRSIDLRTQVTKINNKFVLENPGKTPVTTFVVALENSDQKHLSYIAVRLREHGKPELKIRKIDGKEFAKHNQDATFYSVALRDPLQPERTLSVEVEIALTHQLEPYPREILQKDKQLIKYVGNLYFYTPYPVGKQTTTVHLPSRNVESYTKVKLVSQTDSNLIYGPFDAKKPFEKEELMVHFENNNKFLTVTYLERVLEVSHWGNIAVEEKIELFHAGAVLKGSFSRYVYLSLIVKHKGKLRFNFLMIF